MSPTKNIPLPHPAPYFGAILGKNHYGVLIALTPIYLTLIAFTIYCYTQPTLTREFDHSRGVSVTGLTLAAAILSTIAMWIYTDHVYGYAQAIFNQDAQAGQDEYAQIHVRTWLTEKYNVNVTAREAQDLFHGNTIRVEHLDEFGRTERVRVYLEGINGLRNSVSYDDYVGETPNANAGNPRLLIIEEPAERRIYEWV